MVVSISYGKGRMLKANCRRDGPNLCCHITEPTSKWIVRLTFNRWGGGLNPVLKPLLDFALKEFELPCIIVPRFSSSAVFSKLPNYTSLQ